MSPSDSPATSPTMSNSSSPTPQTVASSVSSYASNTLIVTPVNTAGVLSGQQHHTKPSPSGIPCVAAASRYTAPVHIDVGGTIYTSSLETLTK